MMRSISGHDHGSYLRAGLLATLGCLLLAGSPPPVGAEDVPAAAPPVADDELSQLLAALGAREFQARDRAMQALIAAGQPAIEPIVRLTRRGDHEVATRAVMVLKGIGEKGNIATLEEVLAALERVEASAGVPFRWQANEVRQRLELVRQDRAVEFFRDLGAEITEDYTDTWTSTFIAAPLFTVELGDNWKGTEKDLERLKWLRDVEQVALVGPKVQDSWLRYLRDMPHLMSLKIKRANISAQALEELTHFDRLRALRLMFVPLGDEIVPHLLKCDGLVRLVVISRQVSEEAEQKLKEQFQERAEFPKGAMLGVRAGLEEPWSIREVVEGSAAEKAGLRPHDRIVKYNGQPIDSFQELRTLISQSEPGDTASVEVERGSQTLQMKLVFGEWD